MSTNVLLRVIGILATLAGLFAFHHLALWAFILVFLGGFVVHFTADITGDDLFLDEPVYVAALREAGFVAAIIFGTLQAFIAIPYLLVWLWLSVGTHLVGDALSVKKEIMAFNFQGLLDKITGRSVRFIGLVLAIVAAALLHTHAVIGFAVALALAALNWNFPILRKSQVFTNFADPKYWPTFVLLGAAILFLVPGLYAKAAVGAVLTIFDGMYFTDNPGNY